MPSQLFTVHQECEDCGRIYLPFKVETFHGFDYCSRCEDCEQNANERAYERSLEDYYGGSGPVTLEEQHRAAWEQKRELERDDLRPYVMGDVP